MATPHGIATASHWYATAPVIEKAAIGFIAVAGLVAAYKAINAAHRRLGSKAWAVCVFAPLGCLYLLSAISNLVMFTIGR